MFLFKKKENNFKIDKYFPLRNKFLLLSGCFLIWMFFFDTNSLLVHYKLHKESEQVEKKLRYLRSQIAIEKNWLEKAKSDPDHMEKFAREKFYMKHEQEDVFIVPQKEGFFESRSNTFTDR